MTLTGVTFRGPEITGSPLLDRLPEGYADVLRQLNGFIAFGGGLHVRGVCEAPAWHSLEAAWLGEHALHYLFPVLRATDVPFGEDCVGDQFILRDGEVHRLSAESGELKTLGLGFVEFIEQAAARPVHFLMLRPLLNFQGEGNRLQPGELLGVYPPFVTAESAQQVSLRAVPAHERIAFLADFARQFAGVADGESVQVCVPG